MTNGLTVSRTGEMGVVWCRFRDQKGDSGRTEWRWHPVAESGSAERCLRPPCSCQHLDRQQLVILGHRRQRTFVGGQCADLDRGYHRVLKLVAHEEMTNGSHIRTAQLHG